MNVQVRHMVYLFFAIITTTAIYHLVSIYSGNLSLFSNILHMSSKETSGFHVVTNYPLLVESPWKDRQTDVNVTRLWERQAEVEETLQRNLDHPLVTAVHLLINQDSAQKRLSHLQLRNKSKIRVLVVTTMPSYRDFFRYVNGTLQNCIVSVMNMDIYIGEGFEQLNKTFLLAENVSYVLTRHGRQERRCNMATRRGYCETGYIGSHDAFILALTRPLTGEVLSELDYPMHVYGGDNVLLWVLKYRLGMKLLNPCRYLKLYHNHCVDIHGKFRKRINTNGKSASVQPSGLYD